MRHSWVRVTVGLWLAVVGATAQSPPLEWTAGFGFPGVDAVSSYAFSAGIKSAITFDDGSGPAVFVSGVFTAAGDYPAVNVARFRDGRWSPAGGSGNIFNGFAAWDDGAGPALYAIGKFQNGGSSDVLAKWNGADWIGVGGPCQRLDGGSLTNGDAEAVVVYPVGGAPRLVLAGRFTHLNGVAGFRGVGAWDGSTWTSLDTGLDVDPHFRALAVSSVGGVVRLYAAGSNAVSPAPVPWGQQVARWDGSTWSNVAMPVVGHAPVTYGNPELTFRTLCAFHDGTVERLYLGGTFGTLGASATYTGPLIRYNGSAWGGVPSGALQIVGIALSSTEVYSLATRTTATGPELLVGGVFTHAGTLETLSIARLTSAGWSTIGNIPQSDPPQTYSAGLVFPFQDSGQDRILASTIRLPAPSPASPRFLHPAIFDGAEWRDAERRNAPSEGGDACIDVVGPPGAEAVYTMARGSVFRKDGPVWTPLATLPTPVSPYAKNAVFETFDAGAGSEVFVNGRFVAAGTPGARAVYRVAGGAIQPVGSMSGVANDLLTTDLGNGSRLYAVGTSLSVPGGSTSVAQWDGTAWSNVGGGVPSNYLLAAARFDGGPSGPSLYVAGLIGTIAGNILKWNGAGWLDVGGGVDGRINALCVFDDGTGPALYAGGEFTHAGGAPASGVAKYNGWQWSSVGQGLPTEYGDPFDVRGPRTLAVYDDGLGAGPKLYAGGAFDPSGPYAGGLAVLENGIWVAVPGLSPPVRFVTTNVNRLVAFRDFDRPSLLVQGGIARAGARASDGTARLAPAAPVPLFSVDASGVTFTTSGLIPGRSYFNVFSVEGSMEPIGLGPWAGLYAANPGVLFAQLSLPFGTEPFSLSATSTTYVFGPVLLPPGLQLDVLSADATAGSPVLISPVDRVTLN
jgi:trimeric autotransporter adhesin